MLHYLVIWCSLQLEKLDPHSHLFPCQKSLGTTYKVTHIVHTYVRKVNQNALISTKKLKLSTTSFYMGYFNWPLLSTLKFFDVAHKKGFKKVLEILLSSFLFKFVLYDWKRIKTISFETFRHCFALVPNFFTRDLTGESYLKLCLVKHDFQLEKN